MSPVSGKNSQGPATVAASKVNKSDVVDHNTTVLVDTSSDAAMTEREAELTRPVPVSSKDVSVGHRKK